MVVFLFSCEKEEIEKDTDNIAIEEPVFKRSINYEDFNANKELVKIITNNLNSKNQNRAEDTINQNIKLDYAAGVYFQDHEYHSYTFPLLNRRGEENLKNVFLSSQDDGSYRIFLMEYGQTANEMDRLLLDGTNTPEVFTYTEVDENFQALYSVQCTTVTATISWCTQGNHEAGYDENGNECPLHASYTVTYGTFCEGVGSDSFPGSTFPTSSGTTGGGSGPNQTTSTTTGCRGKNCLDYEISLILGYLNLLGQTELINAVNNLSQSSQVELLDFIQENLDQNGNILPEVEAFIEGALQSMAENPGMSFEEATLLYANNNNLPIVVTPDNPINDIEDYLECFNTNQSATLTIYANEPNPGSGDTHNGTFVGHTYISISQGNNVSTFGFYPEEDNIYPVFNESSEPMFGDDGDGNEPFSVSITTNVTGNQLQNIINFTKNYGNNEYHLDNNNCTDFAIGVGNFANLNLPDCYGSWTGGGGSNPGTLGAHIRNLNTGGNIIVNTTGGTAPATNKDC